MRALKITNTTTVSELIPMLIDKFKPETRSSKDLLDYNSHYMVMVLDGGKLDLLVNIAHDTFFLCIYVRLVEVS